MFRIPSWPPKSNGRTSIRTFSRLQPYAQNVVCINLPNGIEIFPSSMIYLLRPGSCRLAELLSALPDHEEDSTQDSDSSMKDGEDESPQITSLFSTASNDPEESRLEAREVGKYLLAKSFFDCKEYDRCSAVFLPIASAFRPYASSSPESKSQTPTKPAKGKGKATVESPDEKAVPRNPTLPHLSQKSLFLALYAKYVAGEKRKNEESEMILGPADSGSVINKELVGIGAMLEGWFDDRLSQQKYDRNQGWLEYLYGIVLKNGNSEAEAKDQLMASIRLNPWLWCAWEELQDLLGSMEDVRPLLHSTTIRH